MWKNLTHLPSIREWLRGWKMEYQELRWIMSGAPWLWLCMRNDGRRRGSIMKRVRGTTARWC